MFRPFPCKPQDWAKGEGNRLVAKQAWRRKVARWRSTASGVAKGAAGSGSKGSRRKLPKGSTL
eukprot:9389316-Lingulodinium_polyedra.AAC.1